MKKALITVAAGITVALFQPTAHAQADEARAKENGCLNCHAIDTKKVGPAWKESGAKFKGKTAGDLAASIKTKPVHAATLKKTSDKDLNLMSEWILTLGK